MNNWEPILKVIDYFGKPAWWDLYGPGDANAPTLYDIDKDGYITGPSGGRTLYPGDRENIDKYNGSGLNNDQRKALDDFSKDAQPICWPNDPGEWDKDFDVAQKTVSPIELDLDGDGKITSGRELFGNHTLLKNGMEATNDFRALKERDSNGDGVTDARELLTLDSVGIKNLKVAYTTSISTDTQGNQHSQLGSYTPTGGASRSMDDVWFAVDSQRTVNRDMLAVSEAIEALPDLAGMGNVRSLHQAMALDTSGQLQALMTRYAYPGVLQVAANSSEWRDAA
jgi:hypothetical protein